MKTVKIPRAWSNLSLFFFLIVALIGTLLRSKYILDVPFEIKNLIHAHSHTAFQGWIYTIIFLILCQFYLTKEQFAKRNYKLQFRTTIIVLLGILISFSLQGYGLYAILFSCLFQLLNYWFIYSFYQDLKTSKNTVDVKFIKIGLGLGVLSTLMPIAIGYFAAQEQQGTEIYNSLVYTFLHLQYNGWFLFIALGIFFKLLSVKKLPFQKRAARTSCYLFTISVIPAIFLSFLGMSFSEDILPLAIFGGAVQLIALFYFLKSILPIWNGITKKHSKTFKVLMHGFLISFILKILIQSASAIPSLKELAFFNKYNLLAYLHLNFIGVLSFLFIAMMIYFGWFASKVYMKTGVILLFIGFLISEVLLSLNGLGFFTPNSYLFYASVLMLIGVLILLFSKKPHSKI